MFPETNLPPCLHKQDITFGWSGRGRASPRLCRRAAIRHVFSPKQSGTVTKSNLDRVCSPFLGAFYGLSERASKPCQHTIIHLCFPTRFPAPPPQRGCEIFPPFSTFLVVWGFPKKPKKGLKLISFPLNLRDQDHLYSFKLHKEFFPRDVVLPSLMPVSVLSPRCGKVVEVMYTPTKRRTGRVPHCAVLLALLRGRHFCLCGTLFFP